MNVTKHNDQLMEHKHCFSSHPDNRDCSEVSRQCRQFSFSVRMIRAAALHNIEKKQLHSAQYVKYTT